MAETILAKILSSLSRSMGFFNGGFWGLLWLCGTCVGQMVGLDSVG